MDYLKALHSLSPAFFDMDCLKSSDNITKSASIKRRTLSKMYSEYQKNTSRLDCPSSKGSHVPHTKFERPHGKNTKSNFFLIGPELVPTAHLKAQ